MKLKYFTTIIFAFFVTSFSYAQGGFFSRLDHKIVAALNLGATAPVSIPSEIREINSYWPQFTPRLGYNVTYHFSDARFGIGTGILLDYKGMGVKATVKSMYTLVNLKTDDGIIEKEGNFTGKNKTEVKSAYVTVPLFVSYQGSEKWSFRLGGYASYLSSGEFTGIVHDGYLRDESPIGDKLEIPEADFNFSNEMRHLDFGVLLGAEMKINKRFGISGDLNWGLTPIFPSSFTGMDFKMYNIYFALGLTYKL